MAEALDARLVRLLDGVRFVGDAKRKVLTAQLATLQAERERMIRACDMGAVHSWATWGMLWAWPFSGAGACGVVARLANRNGVKRD